MFVYLFVVYLFDLFVCLLVTAPAIVEPGDNTTTEVEEDGFRFFQSECAAFSQTVMIEQIDLVGSCSLYASTQVQNPGWLMHTCTHTCTHTHMCV